jgi:hypothetical protein
MVAPVVPVAIATAVKLVGKPAWKLAEKLARKFMKAKTKKDKTKVLDKAKEKGVNKQFSEIKSGLLKKADKDKPKSTVSKNSISSEQKASRSLAKMQEQERIKAAAKRKRLESVGGYNRAKLEKKMGDPEKVPTYSKYSYDPSIYAKGGSVKKYASGGGIRKARYK